MEYRVTAPLIQATDTSGVVQRFRKGAVLPDSFEADTVKRLKDRGFIEEVKAKTSRAVKSDEADK